MAITKIICNGLNEMNMGSDATPAEAAKYRAFMRSRMAAEFPGAEIEINEADAAYGTRVEVDDQDEYDDASNLVGQFGEEVWSDYCGGACAD